MDEWKTPSGRNSTSTRRKRLVIALEQIFDVTDLNVVVVTVKYDEISECLNLLCGIL
jgi:hypothetical protein